MKKITMIRVDIADTELLREYCKYTPCRLCMFGSMCPMIGTGETVTITDVKAFVKYCKERKCLDCMFFGNKCPGHRPGL